MSPRAIRILAVTVVGLFAAVWLFNREQTGGATAEKVLFPGLKERLDEVTEIRISDAEGEVRVVRDGDHWVVPAKGGYPANTTALRELLLGIAEARKIEQKTSNSELYDQLGVQGVQEEGASGVLVQSEGLDDADFSLILGDPVQREYRYVRVADAPTSWLIDRNPDLPDDTGGWLLSDIADIASSRVQSVTIDHGDGEAIRIHKASKDDANFAVEGIPEGRELSYPSVANSIAAALDNLTLEDVRRAGVEAAQGETPAENDPAAAATAIFTTFDGLEVTVESETANDETWISMSAAALPRADEPADQGGDPGQADNDDSGQADNSAPAEAEATDAAGAAATGEEAAEAPDPAEEAARINARVSGWEYRIPEYKASQLTRGWKDLLSEPESAGE